MKMIEQLNVPSMEQISKEWEAVLMSAPKIVRECQEIDTYGSIIFTRTSTKDVLLELGLFSVDQQTTKNICIPELAKLIPGRYFIAFSMLSADRKVDSLIYMVFDNKNEHIEHVFCYDLRNGINREVQNVQELEEYLDVLLSDANS